MKKECEMIKDLLPLYVDQVCSEESKQYVEEHLKTCTECAGLVEKMQTTMKLPMDTNASDVKGFKKYVNKKIWKRVIIIAALFMIAWVAFSWMITMKVTEIWPDCDAEGLHEYLEVVEMNDGLFLHQQDLFGIGDIMILDTEEAGVLKFYLGEQGLHSLDPTGRYRLWFFNEKYTRISWDEEEPLQKIIYCHKNGEEVTILWER